MRHTHFWIFLFLAGLLGACSGPKQVAKNNLTIVDQKPAGAVDRNTEFEYLFIEALKQKMVGNPQKAVSLLASCLVIDPNSTAAMYELPMKR